MKKILIPAALVLLTVSLGARERHNRHAYEAQFNAIADKVATFKPGGEWSPYPAYTDRAGWQQLFGEDAAAVIKAGEKLLDFEWIYIPATEYLEFEKDADRKHCAAENTNRAALGKLTLAELAEGKGRFIPQIINGLYLASEKSTWAYAVHTSRQKSGRTLPEPQERYISLGAANTAASVAIAWFFFHKEFDKFDPSISKTIQYALDINTFTPYLDSSKDKRGHGWMGFGNGRVNNWNTYCNTYTLQAFLFAQQDPEKLIAAIEKGMKIHDNFMDYSRMDGACEEGPSYWGMAGAKAYELTRLMYDASKGQIDLLKDPQLMRMCIWKSSIDLGDGWAVNYGDGGPRSQGGMEAIFRMGCDMDNQELKDFTLYMLANPEKKKFDTYIESGGDLYRAIESVRYRNRVIEAEKKALSDAGGDWVKMRKDLRKWVKSSYYPDTQTAVLRNENGWILAPKAGYNEESHNHNDVGNFILFYDECPVIIDLGAGTYGKTTFTKERYSANYHINSLGHNVPVINGQPQKDGEEFGAKNVSCNLNAGTFTSDIAGAYTEEAAVNSWFRECKILKDGASVTDSFSLKERKCGDELHFITWGEPTVVKAGLITIKVRDFKGERSHMIKMAYPKNLSAEIEPVHHTNKSLKSRWGTTYQISLKSSPKASLKGKYIYVFSK